MNVDPASLREAIVDEIALQLQPFRKFIEDARAEDVKRWDDLEDKTKTLMGERNEAQLEAKIRKKIAHEHEGEGHRRREWLLIFATGGAVAGVEIVRALIVYGPKLLRLLGVD